MTQRRAPAIDGETGEDAESVAPSVTAGTRSVTERTCGRWRDCKRTRKASPTTGMRTPPRRFWGTPPASVALWRHTDGAGTFSPRTIGYRKGDAFSVVLARNITTYMCATVTHSGGTDDGSGEDAFSVVYVRNISTNMWLLLPTAGVQTIGREGR